MAITRTVVLAVDDSEDDRLLLEMACKKVAPEVHLQTLDSGEKALAYVAGEGKYADRDLYPVAKVMLLDLKMPRVNGFDVLQRLDERCVSSRPYVVVMSTSTIQEDMDKASALGADVFHTKPADFEELCRLVKRIMEFFIPAPPRPPGRRP